ncbi:ferritin-like domain-containing protein [Sinimarinibacterium sp. NLF-5-8]|uniref:ferritin-like domain-containing protein n=1 Tax=Sinimarinibacterium sp. NLF-5-8 TaxID=2698684 RepID=UPI00137BD762|nr:ferritin-like domain-containing protein [Sinimarinibacterium sp. NLF-5-8]QHS09721.1 ferritin-like domain-containing protein [Sinimarinibacterium sp. NLF-5-8]
MSDARAAAFAALIESEPARKCARVAALVWAPSSTRAAALDWSQVPGRPARPELIHPRDVPHRGLGSVAGRCALMHAVAHIEFNAINLALDAVCRFDAMPDDYYHDWLSVAQDEARHFELLRARMADHGAAYGDFAAHNGLWEAAEKTAHDPLLRMALVPRVLEARGLDVTPGMIHRLQEVGDQQTVEVLGVILREEVRHVAIGTRWFEYLCAQRGLEPTPTFIALLAEHGVRVRPPLNRMARAQAGFSVDELALLAID